MGESKTPRDQSLTKRPRNLQEENANANPTPDSKMGRPASGAYNVHL